MPTLAKRRGRLHLKPCSNPCTITCTSHPDRLSFRSWGATHSQAVFSLWVFVAERHHRLRIRDFTRILHLELDLEALGSTPVLDLGFEMPNKNYPWPPVVSEEVADSRLVEETDLSVPKSSGLAATPSNARCDLPIGSLLASKYRLVKQLGTGGMGTVWLATNESLGSDVAIKLIRKDLEQPILTLRLMAEARAIARLGHPNVVRVFDVAQTEQGQPFIVMELLRGRSLGFKIRREGRMPAVVAVQTLLPIAHALAVTHDEGIVHRDLKPDNIVLEEREALGVRPVLVDFGIAKSRELGAAKLTLDGATVGSPEYMSPEQARGDEIDAKADMWAFCVLLYESLLGHVPFTDTNYHRLLRRIIDEPIPSFSRVGIQDDDLWAIIEKGLRKNPQERFQNMRELGVCLARWLLNLGITEDAGHASIRATWLQTPDARRSMVSSVDSTETLSSIPSPSPTQSPSFTRALKKRNLLSRIGWFAAIFVGSILVTVLLKPWLRKLTSAPVVANAPVASAASAMTETAQVPSAVRVPVPASTPTVSAAVSTPESQVNMPKARGSNPTPVASTRTSQRVSAATQTSSTPPRASRLGAAHSAAPPKLDIKTDF